MIHEQGQLRAMKRKGNSLTLPSHSVNTPEEEDCGMVERHKRGIKDSFSPLFLASILSVSTGLFLFDRHLILYKRVIQDKVIVYTNTHNLIPLIKNSLFAFIGISLAVLFLSLILKFKKDLSYLACINSQTVAFVPLLLLIFGRFLYGKAIEYFVAIPLFPFFIFLIVVGVIHLNLVLHLDFNAFRCVFDYLNKNHHRRRQILVTVLILFLMVLLTHMLINRPHFRRFTGGKLFGGDEPKYLRMAYSLATDKDLDVSDEFYIPEGLERAKEEVLRSGSQGFGKLSVIGKDGKIYHLHMPGLSFLMLPGFLLDISIYPTTHDPEDLSLYLNFGFLPEKLRYTSLWLLIIGLFTFFLVARLMYRLVHSLFLLALVLLLFIFSSPSPNFVFQLYPEIAASFFTLLVLNALLFPFKIDWLNHLFIVLGIGYLPWLHQRFIVLSLSLSVVLVIREVFFTKNFKKILIITILLLIAGLSYSYYFYSITGSPMPDSMQKLYGRGFTRFNMFPLGFFGHLFDYSVGMIWLYPWTILALIGIYWGLKLDRKRAIVLLVIFVPYYLFTCFHIAWHGMVREPGRYLVAIFPILLVFLLYTIKAFFKRPTYFHLFFYGACLTIIFLKRKIWPLAFSFRGGYVSHSHFIQMIECFFILVLLYVSIFLSDRLTEKRLALIPLNKISNYLKSVYPQIKGLFPLKKARKSIVYCLILIQVACLLVFLKNWDGEAMSMSVFGSLNKINSINDFQLWKKGNPEVAFEKSDKNFIELFKNVYNFQISPGQEEKPIQLGSTFFYEKIPRGCYRVKLETEDIMLEDASVRVFFLGKSREFRFEEKSGKSVALSTFMLFRDMFVSPDLLLKFETPEPKEIAGKVEIYPIPYVFYGKDLILRPVPSNKSKLIRRKGKRKYQLRFVANAYRAKKKYRFLLYALEAPDEINIEQELLLASYDKGFIKERQPYKVKIGFKLSLDLYKKKSGFALLVYDADNRAVSCKSKLLKTRKNYWVLLKKPPKPAKKNNG